MRVTNQGGSLAGFLIIGALLTLVLVGGLYGLNRYNAEQDKKEVAASDEAKKESASEAKDPEETKAEEKNVSRQTTESDKGSVQNTESKSTSTATTAAPKTDSQKAAGQLPQTGPADSAFAMLVLGTVVFAGTHYVRSRASH